MFTAGSTGCSAGYAAPSATVVSWSPASGTGSGGGGGPAGPASLLPPQDVPDAALRLLMAMLRWLGAVPTYCLPVAFVAVLTAAVALAVAVVVLVLVQRLLFTVWWVAGAWAGAPVTPGGETP